MKKLFIWLFVILAVAGLGVGGYFIYKHFAPNNSSSLESPEANDKKNYQTEVLIDISDLNLDSPNLATMKNGVMLFSNSNDGLWYYSLEDESITRLLAKGKYSSFKEFDDGCFIYSTDNDNKGLYYFDFATKRTTTVIEEGFGYSSIRQVSDKYLISSGREDVTGFYCFDSKTKTTDILKEEGHTWYPIAVFDDYCLVTSYSSEGLYTFNPKTVKLTNLSTDKNYTSGQVVKGGVLLYSFDEEGTTFFNAETKNFTELEIPNGYNTIRPMDEGCFIYASDSGHLGLYYFDYSIVSISKIYSTGWAWNQIQKVSGGYLLSASNYGLLYFDLKSKQASLVFSGGYWGEFVKVDGGYLAYEDWSHSRGILFFDENTKTATKVYTEGYGFSHFDIGDDILFISRECVVKYTKSTKQFTKLADRGIDGCEMVESNGVCIFFARYGGLATYNLETGEYTTVSEFGSYTAEKTENGVTITGDREVYVIDEISGKLKAVAIKYQIPQAA